MSWDAEVAVGMWVNQDGNPLSEIAHESLTALKNEFEEIAIFQAGADCTKISSHSSTAIVRIGVNLSRAKPFMPV